MRPDWKMARWRQPWHQGDTHLHRHGQGYWSATPDPAGQGHQHPDPERSRRRCTCLRALPLGRRSNQPERGPSPPRATPTGRWPRTACGASSTAMKAPVAGPLPLPLQGGGQAGNRFQVVGLWREPGGQTRLPPRWSTATTPCRRFRPSKPPRPWSPWCWENAGAAAPYALVARHMLDAYACCRWSPSCRRPRPSNPESEEVALMSNPPASRASGTGCTSTCCCCSACWP